MAPEADAPEAPETPLEAFQRASGMHAKAAEVASLASSVAGEFLRAKNEARYKATLAIACPYHLCLRPVGEPCDWGSTTRMHPYVTHGMRADLAGVNGEASQARAKMLYG